MTADQTTLANSLVSAVQSLIGASPVILYEFQPADALNIHVYSESCAMPDACGRFGPKIHAVDVAVSLENLAGDLTALAAKVAKFWGK